MQEKAAAKAARRGAASAIPIYVLASEKTTVAELWAEYNVGINGGPAVRELEEAHGNKWREYKGGKELWQVYSHIYQEIERRMAGGAEEAAAVQGVQSMLDAHKREPVPGQNVCTAS